MDFIEWCDLVLDELVGLTNASVDARGLGVNVEQDLASALFGEKRCRQAEFWQSKARLGMHDALRQLANLDLAEVQHGRFCKPTKEGEETASDKAGLWNDVCSVALKPDQEQVIRALNRLSPQGDEDHAWVEEVTHDALLEELGWSDENGFGLLSAVSGELEGQHFVRARRTLGAIKLEATYRSLVWEHKRGFTLESKFIDELVADWETTSVDFKRQQGTKTADQKAELVKDVIALANTQASGRRWLIIGFDDETHSYHGPPDPKLDQEHIEQLMSVYISPPVRVRYEVVDYRLGKVGKLGIVREPKSLPYRVAKSVGDKKRIKKDDVFVRHGSLVEKPSPDEFKAIEEEGRRARRQ